MCRTDLHCANALSDEPVFSPVMFSSPDIPMDQLPHTLDADITKSSAIYGDLEVGELIAGKYPLEWTLKHIQELSATLEFIRTSSTLPEENIWYSDQVYYLQHCLLAIINSPKYGQLDTIFSIAAVIFCCTCFRDVNFNFRVVADGVRRLKDALEALDADQSLMIEKHCHRLFWTSTLGAIAAEGKREKPWLVEKMKTMCKILNLSTWKSAKKILEDILWQSKLDQFGSRLWRETFEF